MDQTTTGDGVESGENTELALFACMDKVVKLADVDNGCKVVPPNKEKLANSLSIQLYFFNCDESPLNDLAQRDMSLAFQDQRVSQPEINQSTGRLDGFHQILVSVVGNRFQGNIDSALEGFTFPELDGDLQRQPVDTNRCRASATKSSGETEAALNKKARIEMPSPLPTFKVRKEKLGDRITSLQQLVSPFGKTDTSSVLHDTIDYIKFLHDQVRVLSAPNSKNYHNFRQQNKEDLTSRGLCLVPVSATFALVTVIESDLWNPFR
ncbi:transcription factor bHLH103-like [Zingiber officinale]|uniref:transcription factor bHLH103-like n=1 Tax=Zingiber officinale TaxID=94328 RepID=UPI001C4AFEDE|nr:transcription factor bHLH103-like [Zingiber officinale]